MCAEMLIVTGLENDRSVARQRTDDAVTSGNAAEVFDRMVRGLGGPMDFVATYEEHLPQAKIKVPVFAESAGYLAETNAFRIGNAIIELGGGRRKLGDVLDLSVGLSDVAAVGEHVDNERPLAVIHASSEDSAERAAIMIRDACEISDSRPEERPVVYETIKAE